MPLDATLAGSSSTSYMTLADANAMATNFGLTNWATLTDAQKSAALFRATVDIDSHRVHDPLPFVIGQSLLFPRETDLIGTTSNAMIPKPVLWACMFQADYHGMNGETDRKNWEGAKGDALKDSGKGSPLCPRAWAAFSKYVSRCGSYVNTYPQSDVYMRLFALFTME